MYYTADGKVSYTFEKFDYLVGNAVKAADIRHYYTYNEMNGLLTSSRIYWNSDLNINYSYHTDFDRKSEGWQLNDYWELFWHEVENEVFN